MSKDKPIRFFRNAAKVLGLSEDALDRYRKKHGDTTITPWWENEAAVRTWFAALIAPKPSSTSTPAAPSTPRRSRGLRRDPGAPLDVDALRRELVGGGS